MYAFHLLFCAKSGKKFRPDNYRQEEKFWDFKNGFMIFSEIMKIRSQKLRDALSLLHVCRLCLKKDLFRKNRVQDYNLAGFSFLCFCPKCSVAIKLIV